MRGEPHAIGNKLALSLLLISGLGAQSLSGYLARGTVTLTGPRGHERSGTITVAAGPGLCAVTIALGAPVLRRRYTAVMGGQRVHIAGPAGMLRSAPLPLGRGAGCALLPVGRTAPVSLTLHGQAVSIAYAGNTVTETVDGSVRLRAAFTTVGPHTFAAGEFAPPPPKKAAEPRPGGGQ